MKREIGKREFKDVEREREERERDLIREINIEEERK